MESMNEWNSRSETFGRVKEECHESIPEHVYCVSFLSYSRRFFADFRQFLKINCHRDRIAKKKGEIS